MFEHRDALIAARRRSDHRSQLAGQCQRQNRILALLRTPRFRCIRTARGEIGVNQRHVAQLNPVAELRVRSVRTLGGVGKENRVPVPPLSRQSIEHDHRTFGAHIVEDHALVPQIAERPGRADQRRSDERCAGGIGDHHIVHGRPREHRHVDAADVHLARELMVQRVLDKQADLLASPVCARQINHRQHGEQQRAAHAERHHRRDAPLSQNASPMERCNVRRLKKPPKPVPVAGLNERFESIW